SGLSDAPLRAREAEESLLGKVWGEKAVIETLPVLQRSVEVAPPEAGGAAAGYLKQLVGTLFQKFHHQHPRPESSRPEVLTAAGEFGRLDESFYDPNRS